MPSENGWNPAWVGQESLQWVKIPGTEVNIQFQKGWPLKVLRAFAADYNAYVEPLRDRDSASYTPTNSVSTSNHLNGTGMDLNWDSHPFHVKGTFSAAQMKTIRQLLEFYEGTVFWAGDWNSPIDEMHWQMGYGTFNNPDVGSFISRKVRSDGFSTFKRGEVTAQPKVEKEEAKVPSSSEPLYASVSIYKEPGEGPKYTIAQLIQSIDGFAHREAVETAALQGSFADIDKVVRVASGQGAFKDAWTVNHAMKVLARIELESPAALQAYRESKGI